MMNSFIFCLSENLFISPSKFWRTLPVVPLRRGHYSSKGVVEQILVGVFRKQPPYVTTHLSDGEVQPVVFTYCARTSTLGLVRFSLNTGVDRGICIKWQNGTPGCEHREQRVPFHFSLGFFLRFVLHSNFPGSKSFIRYQCTNEQQISLFLAFTC